MGFQKVEYSFPDEEKDSKKEDIEIESSGAIEIDLSGEEPAKKVIQEKDDEVDIEVIDDTPKEDRNRKASKPPEDITDEELEDYSDKVRKRIQHFSKGYHDERRAKEASQRERQEMESYAKSLVDENTKLKGSVEKNQTALLEQAKKNSAIEILSAKRSYKRAYEAGDADKLLDAQEKLTNAKIKADKLADFKAEPLQEAEVPVQIPQQQSQTVVDTKASDWAAENSWFGDDDEMTAYAMGVHSKLVKQGVDTESDEYYESINARMRNTFPEEFGEIEEEPEDKPSKRKSNVVAPATRSTAPKKVRLTQTQVAIAKKLGVPLELYAKKVAEEMRKI